MPRTWIADEQTNCSGPRVLRPQKKWIMSKHMKVLLLFLLALLGNALCGRIKIGDSGAAEVIQNSRSNDHVLEAAQRVIEKSGAIDVRLERDDEHSLGSDYRSISASVSGCRVSILMWKPTDLKTVVRVYCEGEGDVSERAAVARRMLATLMEQLQD